VLKTFALDVDLYTFVKIGTKLISLSRIIYNTIETINNSKEFQSFRFSSLLLFFNRLIFEPVKEISDLFNAILVSKKYIGRLMTKCDE